MPATLGASKVCREGWSAGPGAFVCILGLLESSEARLERSDAA
jgi:hypothetical protein